MPLDYIVSALLTLLVVVDPVGLAPTFLAVTDGMPQRGAAQRGAAGLRHRRMHSRRHGADR